MFSADLEEREQLKSPQLVESATSPTFKMSSPSPDLDMYQSSSAYKTDAFESNKYKSDYDSKYRSSSADYVDSGRYKSDYDSKYNNKYKSDYTTGQQPMKINGSPFPAINVLMKAILTTCAYLEMQKADTCPRWRRG